jgi:hypothetical protein
MDQITLEPKPTTDPFPGVCFGELEPRAHLEACGACQHIADCIDKYAANHLEGTVTISGPDGATVMPLENFLEEAEQLDAAEEAAALEAVSDALEDLPQENQRPDYRVIDNNTGELVQLTLIGAAWHQYKVNTLRLSISGGDEFIKELFDQLVDGGELTPGAIVEVNARGTVKEHSPVYKKGGHEGKTVITLDVVRKIHVMGHMNNGKIEAAQNVDEEPKAYEEPGSEPVKDCTTCKHEASEGELPVECQACDEDTLCGWEAIEETADAPQTCRNCKHQVPEDSTVCEHCAIDGQDKWEPAPDVEVSAA